MLTVSDKNFLPYDAIQDSTNSIVNYENLFTEDDISVIQRKNMYNPVKTSACLSAGLFQLTGRFFVSKPRELSMAALFFKDGNIIATKKGHNMFFHYKKGSILVFGEDFRKTHEFKSSKDAIFLYEENVLPIIYSSIDSRLEYSKTIQEAVREIEKLPPWKQYIQNYLSLVMIGRGSYANVFRSRFYNKPYAVKISKIKSELTGKDFSVDLSSWHEVFMLNDIIKPILEKKICPNLPLLIKHFTCDECLLEIDDKPVKSPGIIIVTELANGNLKNYVQVERKEEEIFSALFQIMAAIHTIQYYAQVMNYDVKKENILYYNVRPGGFWKYRIRGKDYYVPNYGKLFVLNDFGISRSMSPKYMMYRDAKDKSFRLGHRFAIVKDGVFVPLNVENQIDSNGKVVDPITVQWEDYESSFGAEFRIDRSNDRVVPLKVEMTKEMKEYLEKNNVSTNTSSKHFFTKPEIIPPFEFYNDTQDCIRMFTGGKRTTQRGNHNRNYPGIPESVVKKLRKYVGEGETMKNYLFSYDPSQILAGYFIQDFFSFYRKQPVGKILDSYVIT